MLRAYRQDRIIILSTHYMDEADVLGDRIGIMSHGKLVCLGTPLFLKNRYGVGYNLTLEKTSKDDNEEIESYLKAELEGDIRKLSEIGREITFQVPVEASKSFKTFFEKFDKDIANLGIESYGISITTMEEVFLAVGDGRDMSEHKKEKHAIKQLRTGTGTGEFFADEESPEKKSLLLDDTPMQK